MNQKLLYLSRKDVDSLNLPLKDIIDALEKMFKEKSRRNVEMPPKPGIHTRKNAYIHAMPAYIPSMNSAGLKWSGGYPNNYKKNLPYIHGLLILNDPETGIPISVMDSNWITEMRTGAATAVAAKYMARKNSEVVGIIGCGVQRESNLAALNEVIEIKLLKVFDIDNQKANTYKEKMQDKFSIEIKLKNQPQDVVRESDIIVTAIPLFKNPDPIIEYSWIKKGAFCCPLDLDSSFKPEVFSRSDILSTDDLRQFKHFKQELGYFQKFSRNDLYELCDIVVGKKPGRENDSQISISINIGLGLEDMATASLLYWKAKEKAIGTWLNL